MNKSQEILGLIEVTVKDELVKELDYKGKKIEVHRQRTAFGNFITVYIDGQTMKKGPNLSVDMAIKNAKSVIDSNKEESLDNSMVDDLANALDNFVALAKKAIPNIRKTSAAQAAIKSIEKYSDDFIAIANAEVEESTVDERTAYMVNPSDYGNFHSAFLKFRDATKGVQVSPKATAAQKNEFKRLKDQFDNAMGELEDAVSMMGDTEEVATENKVEEIIKHEGSKWNVYTKDGSKKLGSHDTEKDAKAQLAAIEISKHGG